MLTSLPRTGKCRDDFIDHHPHSRGVAQIGVGHQPHVIRQGPRAVGPQAYQPVTFAGVHRDFADADARSNRAAHSRLELRAAVASWFAWPSGKLHEAPARADTCAATPSGVYLLFAQYAFMAAGLVPAMVFLVDYVARGLGDGAHIGAMIWVMYGLGAIAGPVTYGFLADKLGARLSIRVVLVVQAIALGLLPFAGSFTALAALAVILGSFPPGIVPLALARVHELLPNHHQQQVAWSRATASFATFQALSGFAYSALFNRSGGQHALLFMIAAGAIVVALALELSMILLNRRPLGTVPPHTLIAAGNLK